MTQTENLSPLLKNVAQREAQLVLDELTGLKAVVVSSIDGFDIASATKGDVDAVRMAAMASSVAAIGAVVAQETSIGAPSSIVINSEFGFVQVFTVDRPDGQLVVNFVSDSSGVLAQVTYRGRLFAKVLLSA